MYWEVVLLAVIAGLRLVFINLNLCVTNMTGRSRKVLHEPGCLLDATLQVPQILQVINRHSASLKNLTNLAVEFLLDARVVCQAVKQHDHGVGHLFRRSTSY